MSTTVRGRRPAGGRAGPGRALAALLACVATLLLATAAPAQAQQQAAAQQATAVAAGTWDGRSRLTVTLPDAGDAPPTPVPVTVAVDGVARPADAVPLLSERTATVLVVDASDAGRSVLAPGLSGAASVVLAAPPAGRSAVVADTTPPTVVSPLQAGPAATLRGLAAVRPGGDRQTVAALDLALAQMPPEADAPRLVLLYTAAPDTPAPAGELAARLTAVGAVLAVVVPTADGAVPPYWAAVADATGGAAVATRDPGVVEGFDAVAPALGARYLVTFPAPDRLPAAVVVRADTSRGPVTAEAQVPAPVVSAAVASAPAGGGSTVDLVAGLLALALIVGGTVVAVRRHVGRRAGPDRETEPDAGAGARDTAGDTAEDVVQHAAPAPAGDGPAAASVTWSAWNIPDRREPVVARTGLTSAVRKAARSGGPVVLRPAGGRTATGTTTAMVEFAHARRSDYDIAWWVGAADAPFVADRLAELAEVLGLAAPTDTARAATERLFAALRERGRWLLIFDDAGSPRQLDAFLPAGPGHVLIGSADPDWTGQATAVDVRPLYRDEAVRLLRSHRSRLAVGEADGVAAALGDAPAAVDLAGATLADTGMSVSTYLRLLAEHARLPQAAQAPDDAAAPSPADGAACAVALDRLAADHPAAPALLTTLAWLGPEPVPLSLLTAHPEVLPAPLVRAADLPARLPDLLAVVARRGLARVDADTVTLPRTPAALLLARSGGDGPAAGSGAAGSGAAGSGAEWAGAAVRLLRAALPADPTDPAGRTTWRRLLPHVVTVTDPGRPLDDVLLDVGWLLLRAGRHLRARGEPRTARALCEDAYDLYRDRLGPDHPDTLAAARTLADDLEALDEHDRARRILREAGASGG